MATLENKKVKLQRNLGNQYKQMYPASNAYATSYNNDKTTNMLEEMQEVANKYIAPNAEYWNNTYPTNLYINEYSYMCTADSTICILTPVAEEHKLYVYVNYDGGISDVWMQSVYVNLNHNIEKILGAEINLGALGYDLLIIGQSSSSGYNQTDFYKGLLYGYPSGSEALANEVTYKYSMVGAKHYTLSKCPAGFLLSYINSSKKLIVKLHSYLYDDIDPLSNNTKYRDMSWDNVYESSATMPNAQYIYMKYSKKGNVIYIGVQDLSSLNIYAFDFKRTNLSIGMTGYSSTNLNINGICIGCVEAFNDVYFLFNNGLVVCPSVKNITSTDLLECEVNFNNIINVGEFYPYIIGTKYKLFFIDDNGNVKYSSQNKFINGYNNNQNIEMDESTTYKTLQNFSPIGIAQFCADENNKGIVGMININTVGTKCINTYIAPAV